MPIIPFDYTTPYLPSEITLQNWNDNTYYFQTYMQTFKMPYSALKQTFTNEKYFNSLANKTWDKLYPVIVDWIKCNNFTWDTLPLPRKKEIFKGIMINIEFLRKNKTVEELIVKDLSLQNFTATTSLWQLYSDKSLLGEDCLGHFQTLGMLRIGIY